MYIHNCPQCGKQYSTEEKVSPVKCPFCGAEMNVSYPDEQQAPQQQAPQQQVPQQQQQPPYQQYQQPGYQQPVAPRGGNVFDPGPSGKSRGVTGLLAILLGTLGVHYFYVGKPVPGVIFLLVSILTLGFGAIVTGIIALIQGILLLTSTTEADFENKWVNPMNSFPFF